LLSPDTALPCSSPPTDIEIGLSQRGEEQPSLARLPLPELIPPLRYTPSTTDTGRAFLLFKLAARDEVLRPSNLGDVSCVGGAAQPSAA